MSRNVILSPNWFHSYFCHFVLCAKNTVSAFVVSSLPPWTVELVVDDDRAHGLKKELEDVPSTEAVFLFEVFLVNFRPHLHRCLGYVGLLARSAYLLVIQVEFGLQIYPLLTNCLWCLFISCILLISLNFSIGWRIPPRWMFDTRES